MRIVPTQDSALRAPSWAKFSRPCGTVHLLWISEANLPTGVTRSNTLITLKARDGLHVEGLWK